MLRLRVPLKVPPVMLTCGRVVAGVVPSRFRVPPDSVRVPGSRIALLAIVEAPPELVNVPAPPTRAVPEKLRDVALVSVAPVSMRMSPSSVPAPSALSVTDPPSMLIVPSFSTREFHVCDPPATAMSPAGSISTTESPLLQLNVPAPAATSRLAAIRSVAPVVRQSSPWVQVESPPTVRVAPFWIANWLAVVLLQAPVTVLVCAPVRAPLEVARLVMLRLRVPLKVPPVMLTCGRVVAGVVPSRFRVPPDSVRVPGSRIALLAIVEAPPELVNVPAPPIRAVPEKLRDVALVSVAPVSMRMSPSSVPAPSALSVTDPPSMLIVPSFSTREFHVCDPPATAMSPAGSISTTESPLLQLNVPAPAATSRLAAIRSVAPVVRQSSPWVQVESPPTVRVAPFWIANWLAVVLLQAPVTVLVCAPVRAPLEVARLVMLRLRVPLKVPPVMLTCGRVVAGVVPSRFRVPPDSVRVPGSRIALLAIVEAPPELVNVPAPPIRAVPEKLRDVALVSVAPVSMRMSPSSVPAPSALSVTDPPSMLIVPSFSTREFHVCDPPATAMSPAGSISTTESPLLQLNVPAPAATSRLAAIRSVAPVTRQNSPRSQSESLPSAIVAPPDSVVWPATFFVSAPPASSCPAPVTVAEPRVVAPATSSTRLLANDSVEPVGSASVPVTASLSVISTLSPESSAASSSASGSWAQLQFAAASQLLPGPVKLHASGTA